MIGLGCDNLLFGSRHSVRSISLPFSSSLVKIAPDTNEMISQKGTTIPKIIHMSTILMYNVLGRFDDRPMNLEAQTLR